MVTQGLAPGEKVITEGAGNLHDGDRVKPAPARAKGASAASPEAGVKSQSSGETG